MTTSAEASFTAAIWSPPHPNAAPALLLPPPPTISVPSPVRPAARPPASARAHGRGRSAGTHGVELRHGMGTWCGANADACATSTATASIAIPLWRCMSICESALRVGRGNKKNSNIQKSRLEEHDARSNSQLRSPPAATGVGDATGRPGSNGPEGELQRIRRGRGRGGEGEGLYSPGRRASFPQGRASGFRCAPCPAGALRSVGMRRLAVVREQ